LLRAGRAAVIAIAELLALAAWVMLFAGLPLWLGLSLLILIDLMAFAVVRLGWSRPVRSLELGMVWACLGLAFATGGSVGGGMQGTFLGLLAGVACVVAQMLYSSWLGIGERPRHRLPIRRGPVAAPVIVMAGDLSIALTPPEQLRDETASKVRFLLRGERGMGGPVDGDYILPGGLVLTGGCADDGVLSPDGRWFVVGTTGSRDADGCNYLLDGERRLLWRLPAWRQFGWQDSLLWIVPDDGGLPRPLHDVLDEDPQAPMDFLACGDLWFPRDYLERHRTPSLAPGPASAPAVALHRSLPASLSALADPPSFLEGHRYRLLLDGQDSGFMVQCQEDLCWREDGEALAILATAPKGYDRSWHVWTRGHGWRDVEPWIALPDDPRLQMGQPQSLTTDTLRVAGRLTEHGRRGWPDSWDTVPADGHEAGAFYRGGNVYSEVQVPDGLEPSMALRVRTDPGRSFDICRSLDTSAHWLECGDVRIVPVGLAPDGRQGRYRYEGPGWSIEHALLEHRVSPDRRWWTTIAAADAPGLPCRLFALDTNGPRLHALDMPWPLLSLDSIADGELQATVLRGWLAGTNEPDPLHRCDVALAGPEQAVSFVRDHASREGRFWLRMQRIALLPPGPKLLPDWHVPQAPLAANAAVELLLPAPRGDDAAWLFGVDTSWRDGRLDPRLPRAGYLRTRSGLAMADVSPSLLWSEDGRYLAFAQWRRRGMHGERDGEQWLLHLFDARERELFRHPQPPGCMPQLTGMRNGQLQLRIYDREWIERGERSRKTSMPLAGLLDPALRVPLHEGSGLWFPDAMPGHAQRWVAMGFPGPTA
jgi:hypothetical protein